MAKQITYTEQQASDLAARFAAGETVADLAVAFGKSVQSVTAKLSRLGVYKKAEKAQAGAKVTKADLVATIEGRYAVDAGTFAEMEKLTKATLMALACQD